MQDKFFLEFKKTSSNKFRSSNDMQYSFSYFYFLINEKINKNIEEIFDEFDVDGSR